MNPYGSNYFWINMLKKGKGGERGEKGSLKQKEKQKRKKKEKRKKVKREEKNLPQFSLFHVKKHTHHTFKVLIMPLF